MPPAADWQAALCPAELTQCCLSAGQTRKRTNRWLRSSTKGRKSVLARALPPVAGRHDLVTVEWQQWHSSSCVIQDTLFKINIEDWKITYRTSSGLKLFLQLPQKFTQHLRMTRHFLPKLKDTLPSKQMGPWHSLHLAAHLRWNHKHCQYPFTLE